MDRKVAKDLLHVRDWLDRARDIVSRGQDACAEDALLQLLLIGEMIDAAEQAQSLVAGRDVEAINVAEPKVVSATLES